MAQLTVDTVAPGPCTTIVSLQHNATMNSNTVDGCLMIRQTSLERDSIASTLPGSRQQAAGSRQAPDT
eukprot:COSAG06_NODE_4133_length_4538_cov_25.938107_2_plen_68_part_00